MNKRWILLIGCIIFAAIIITQWPVRSEITVLGIVPRDSLTLAQVKELNDDTAKTVVQVLYASTGKTGTAYVSKGLLEGREFPAKADLVSCGCGGSDIEFK